MPVTYEKPDGVQVKLVMMSPTMASKILENMESNRNVRMAQVNWLVRQIREKNWQVINNGIGIGKNGKLYDGQHRLWAVVMSEITVPVLVTYGLDEKARAAIDKGLPRVVADELRMFFNVDYPRARLAWVRLAVNAATGHLAGGGWSVPVKTTEDYWEFVEHFEEGIDKMVEILKKSPGVPLPFQQAPCAGALAFAYKSHSTKIAEFAVQVRDGVNLEKGSPALALRRVLLEENAQQRSALKHPPAVLAKKVLRAALAHVKGETMTRCDPSEVGLAYFAKAYSDARKLHQAAKQTTTIPVGLPPVMTTSQQHEALVGTPEVRQAG